MLPSRSSRRTALVRISGNGWITSNARRSALALGRGTAHLSGAPDDRSRLNEQDTTMRHILFLAVAAAATLSPCSAQAQAEAPSVRVAYGDLNLSTTAGRERLDRRLAAAVKRVCPSVDVRDLAAQQAARRCAADTRSNLKQTVASVLNRQGVALASLSPSNARTSQ
jgi:UrcA family protein